MFQDTSCFFLCCNLTELHVFIILKNRETKKLAGPLSSFSNIAVKMFLAFNLCRSHCEKYFTLVLLFKNLTAELLGSGSEVAV